MLCIGNTRVSEVRVGGDEIVAAYLGSSTFDYLPYLFVKPKSVYLFSWGGNKDEKIEANINWNISQNN